MKVEMPKAIFLDLDDTIIAFEVLKDECWNRVMDEFSDRLAGVETRKAVAAVLRNSSSFWSDPKIHKEWRQKLDDARKVVVSNAMKDLGIEDVDLSNEIADRFSHIREKAMYVFPGAVNAINQFRDWDIDLILITNGSLSAQRDKLNRFKLEPLFDHILIEGEQGVGKPDEKIYRIALDKADVEASDTIMIGDNIIWDVIMPQSIGIRGVWVDNRKREDGQERDSRPYLTINTLSDILEFFNKK